jgi:phage tail protein X
MTYTTTQGDTWDGISFKLYGSERFVTSLIEANPDHMQTAIFSGGVKLSVPDQEIEQSTTLPPWKVGI